MSVFTEDRWLLEAVFDSVQETVDAGVYEGGLGEAAEFYQRCRQAAEEDWGYLNEEVDESVLMEGETVKVSLNMIDPFEGLFRWLVAYTSPRSVRLTRTVPRAAP